MSVRLAPLEEWLLSYWLGKSGGYKQKDTQSVQDKSRLLQKSFKKEQDRLWHQIFAPLACRPSPLAQDK